MEDGFFKIEANSEGVWLSALTDDVSHSALTRFLRAQGVRKYDDKELESFVKQKNRTPRKIAGRNEDDEKSTVIAVQISKDALSAAVMLEPPFFTKPWVTQEELKQVLSDKNVVYGIDDAAVAKVVELHLTDDAIQVAWGTPAQNGENAAIELLVDPDQKPDIDQDAEKIDHRTRSVFVNVQQGQEIALKHPATPGVDGTSVLGLPIKAVPGKDISFPAGSGLEVSEDGLVLSASFDGCLMRKDKKLFILPELEVKGDVDFGVGNVDFTGSVKINGAVREGFQVIAGGNIDVKEMVEGARLESRGDIVIHGGVRGMGKAQIIADGNIAVGFIDQASVQSASDIKVKDSVFHSDMSAQNSITVMGGQKGQIAGGTIQAGLEITCLVLGSEMGTKTKVTVGVSPKQAERRKELQTLITQHKENLSKLDLSIEFLKKQEAAGALDEKKRAMLLTATKTKFQLQSALSSAENELKEIEERFELTRARGVVRVKDVCYPGVQVHIRGSAYVVREPLKFLSFVYEDGEVRLRSFDH